MHKSGAGWLGVILALAVSAACGPAVATQAGPGPLRVVATFSVLADFVRNVGGEHVALTVLAGPGVDSHTYSPAASDAAALARAQVLVENGLGFETWLDDLYSASGSHAVRAVASDGIKTRTAGNETMKAGDANEASSVDPHVWNSATNAVDMVDNIRDALAVADPANATEYAANADAYIAQLEELDNWIRQTVEQLPAERRVLVTTHDTFGYFADRYGFQVVGTVLPTSTEGASPSARDLAALVEVIRAAGVPAVFGENVSTNSLLSQVAQEAGVTVVASLYTDALGPEGSPAATYINMMRFNTSTMVDALASQTHGN